MTTLPWTTSQWVVSALATIVVVRQAVVWILRHRGSRAPAQGDPDLGWLVDAAAGRAQARGRALFRVRSLALRVPSLIGLAGVALARYVIADRRAGVAVLAVSLLPAIAFAPGLQAATLAAARGEDVDSEQLWSHMGRAPAYARLVVARWVVVLLAGVLFPPLGWWRDLRLSLAGFVSVDDGDGPISALRKAHRLTAGTSLRRVWLGVLESIDAVARYGVVRASLDGRVRRALAQALLYDHLVAQRDGVQRVANVAAVQRVVATAPPATTAATHPPDVAAGNVVDPARPACPRCSGPLERANVPDVAIGHCVVCAGVWLDNATCRKLVEGRLAPSEIAVSRTRPQPGAPSDDGSRVPCPTCGSAMKRTYVPAARLHVDACAVHGTWFDGGELERAATGFARSREEAREIARLVASARNDAGAVYLRGPGAIVRETASALASAARTGRDMAMEGREEDREEMIGQVIGAALDLLLRDKDGD